MPHVTSHPDGNFCWLEVGTTDTIAAKKFYSGLFGWTANDIPIGENEFYTIFMKDGKDAAALYKLRPDMLSMGVPPHWGIYVSVKNVDESAKKAKSLGATIFMEPFDVMTAGRMAAMQDPAGAGISLWQGKNNNGIGVINEANAFCWADLVTNNEDAASRFYSGLFGWEYEVTPGTNPVYSYIVNNGTNIGGKMTMPPEWGNAPSHWTPYFNVKDCDASANKAVSLGGKLMIPPTEIPTVGKFAMIQDPLGATFSIIYLSRIG